MADNNPEQPRFFTALPSAVRAAATATDWFYNNGTFKGILAFLDITVVPGVQTIQLNIETEDVLTGVLQTYAVGTTRVGTGNTYFLLYPGAVETIGIGNLEVQALPLPGKWRIRVTHSGAGNFTYSVSVQQLA